MSIFSAFLRDFYAVDSQVNNLFNKKLVKFLLIFSKKITKKRHLKNTKKRLFEQKTLKTKNLKKEQKWEIIC